MDLHSLLLQLYLTSATPQKYCFFARKLHCYLPQDSRHFASDMHSLFTQPPPFKALRCYASLKEGMYTLGSVLCLPQPQDMSLGLVS